MYIDSVVVMYWYTKLYEFIKKTWASLAVTYWYTKLYDFVKQLILTRPQLPDSQLTAKIEFCEAAQQELSDLEDYRITELETVKYALQVKNDKVYIHINKSMNVVHQYLHVCMFVVGKEIVIQWGK